MTCSRVSVLRAGLFGALLAVASTLPAAGPVSSSAELILEKLEFSESSVLSYADAIAADFSANSETPSFPENTLSGGTLETNELFIRHLPGSGFADVYISLMIVGTLDGCPSSMSTLNQTTVDPIVVDAGGSATAVIEASWNWTRQLNQAGVCAEKVAVTQWTETYTIELTFTSGVTSAEVGYGNQVESLGSPPPPQQQGTPVQTAVTSPTTRVAPGADDGGSQLDSDDDPTADETADMDAADAEVGDTANQAAQSGDSSGSLPLGLLPMLIFLVLALAGWLGYVLVRRFFRSRQDYKRVTNLIVSDSALRLATAGAGGDPVAKPDSGDLDDSSTTVEANPQELAVSPDAAAEEMTAGLIDLASGTKSTPSSPPPTTYTLRDGRQWVWAPKTIEVDIKPRLGQSFKDYTHVLHADGWYQGCDRGDGRWDIYDIRGEELLGEDEGLDVIRTYRETGRPNT